MMPSLYARHAIRNIDPILAGHKRAAVPAWPGAPRSTASPRYGFDTLLQSEATMMHIQRGKLGSRCAAFAVWLAGLGWAATVGWAAENELLQQLTTQGVVMGQGPAVLLPAPVLADGLSAEAQDQALRAMKQVRGADPLQALGGSEYKLDLQFGKKHFPGPPTARRLDIYFIVDSELAQVADEEFLKARFSQGNAQPGEVHTLNEQELSQRGLSAESSPGRKVRYAGAEFDIFERVRVSGGGMTVLTESESAVVLAAQLDRRFDNDADFPNAWRPLKLDAHRKPVPGEPQPYSGVGAYVKATALQAKPGAKNAWPRVFVEYHLVFDEPQGWFNGQPILSSKLPIAARDGVRKFRDALAKQNQAPAESAANR